jgi:isoamylase
MLATLLLSQGTPMMLAGDEFGRTQQGNNNAYCQDSEISWLDWSIGDKGAGLIRFVQKLTKLRHQYPILRRSRFLTGAYNEDLGVKDVTWINANGGEMQDQDWDETNMQCFGMLMDGRSQSSGIRQRGQDATMLLVMNAHSDVVGFKLPECTAKGGGCSSTPTFRTMKPAILSASATNMALPPVHCCYSSCKQVQAS